MLDAVLLVAYVALPLLSWWRSRSIAWTVIALTASISFFGAAVSFAIDHGHVWTRVELQVVLLIALVVVALIAFVRQSRRDAGMRRQFVVIVLPALLVGGFVAVLTIRLTSQLAFFTPVGYLMGHFQAEDNAKWLDFTSQLASGHGIVQGVPMGGPLELVLTGFATVMGAASQILLHGYNEVAVAANTVVLGEYAMAILAPLALAPLVEARFIRPSVDGSRGWVRVPGPLVWLGAGILVMAVVLVTEYGHLTWQFTAFISALWVTTFLTGSTVPRARLLTSLVIAAGMTVWVPLNVLAILILVVAVVVLVAGGVLRGWRRLDWWGLALTLLVAIALSIAHLLYDLAHPSVSQLGQVGDSHDFVDLARHDEAHPMAGVTIWRPNAPLIFANAETVLGTIATQARAAGAPAAATTASASSWRGARG